MGSSNKTFSAVAGGSRRHAADCGRAGYGEGGSWKSFHWKNASMKEKILSNP